MEKVVQVLLGSSRATALDLAAALRGAVVPRLHESGARSVQLNVLDASIGDPFGLPPDPGVPLLGAAVGAWVSSAGALPLSDLLPDPGDGGRWHGYVVCESEPLPNSSHLPAPDGRVPGFSQLVMLRRPDALSWVEWRDRWQGDHTALAIATQSTFRYVQNVVLRPLGSAELACAAIVEECFPAAAASDLHAFFDATDDERLAANMAAMSASCDRFMDGAAPTAWTVEYRVPDP